MLGLDGFIFFVKLYAVVLSVIAIVRGTRRLRHLWLTRHLRRVWGIRNGDRVVVVCSELDEPLDRQWVEPREFIYNLKYGDIDALFEVMLTLLRLYPSLKVRLMSSGEAEQTRLDLSRHLILIGGPDYNKLTERVLSWGQTQFSYRSPDSLECSVDHPDEIVLYDRSRDREFCYSDDRQDFGYFERLQNPHHPKSRIILIGGCHTIGVTGAVKAFSMAESEEGELSTTVLDNAALVSKMVRRAERFSVLVKVERISQTVSVPIVVRKDVSATES